MFVNLKQLASDFFKKGKNILLEEINDRQEQSFNRALSELLKEVESHPISVELSSHSKPSAFLKGTNGSLFGFIGFPAGYEPITELIKFLTNNIKYIPQTNLSLAGLTRFNASIPSIADFKTVFKLEWEPGRSWVYAIEDGISGLGYYINNKYGRSKEGIQIETVINKSEFTPVPYITPILKNFKERLIRYA
jgi:hypothetical protein